MVRGDRLKQLRNSKGLTQSDLGRLINITKVSICGYEKGNRTPNLDTLLDICEALGTTPGYLMGTEINVVMEANEAYNFYMSSDEIKIISELRKDKQLYNKIILDPKRTIELLKNKLK